MKTMKIGVIALLALLAFMADSRDVRGEGAYRFAMVLGDVKVTVKGASHRPAVGETLAGGEIIVTGANAMADIAMGGKGYMRIQEKSTITVRVSRKSGDDSDMDMPGGNVMLIMSKITKGNDYEVKTRTQVASVRGTIFRVAGDEDKSQLDVFTGQVQSSPVVKGEVQKQISQLVGEGQSLSLDKLLVLDILAKKKKFTLSALRAEVKDMFMKQALLIRDNPEFKKQNADLRKELDERVLKLKQELKDKKLDKGKLLEEMMRKQQK
jgi:ferric-dicitrate binding protein FerR (iron transport regulator)